MFIEQKVGGFFPMDNAGNILNPTSWSKISPSLRPLLEDVINLFQENEGQNLHSIWLRGSVPRGLYSPTYSDLDIFALVKYPNISWQAAPWAKEAYSRVQKKYPRTPPIEWQLSSWYPNFYAQNSRLSFFLKTQSLCLFGENFLHELPKFKISPDIQMNLKWLNEDVALFFQQNKPSIVDKQTIIKVVIRSAFESVMLKEKKYTPDLYWCAETFSKYHPESKKPIFELLEDFIFNNKTIFKTKENIKKVKYFIDKSNS